MGLQKSMAFRGGEKIRSDERSALVYRMLSMPAVLSRIFVYPDLFSIHDLPAMAGLPDTSALAAPAPHPYAGARVNMPQAQGLSLTVKSLSSDGAYILDSGGESPFPHSALVQSHTHTRPPPAPSP